MNKQAIAIANGDATPEEVASMAGMIRTSGLDGSTGSAVLIETGLVQNRMNNIIQFSIDNTGVGSTNQRVRIGSEAAAPDFYAAFGLSAGAADDAIIADQGGVGCLAIQGFSKLVAHKPVIITRIKFIAAVADSQLQQPIKYRSLQFDGTVDEINQNVAFGQQRSDNRDNLVEKRGLWVLDGQQFLEYVVLAGKSIDIFLEISGFSNTVAFKQIAQ